jgi:hypothetical protein
MKLSKRRQQLWISSVKRMLQELATDHRNHSAYADPWTRAATAMASAWRIRTADPTGSTRSRQPPAMPSDWPAAVPRMLTALQGRLASRARRANAVGGTTATGWAYWAAERALVTARRRRRQGRRCP